MMATLVKTSDRESTPVPRGVLSSSLTDGKGESMRAAIRVTTAVFVFMFAATTAWTEEIRVLSSVGIKAVVVYTPTATPTMPCGACRQVINEFGSRAVVIGICNSAKRVETTLPALLTEAFGPENLIKASGTIGRKAR